MLQLLSKQFGRGSSIHATAKQLMFLGMEALEEGQASGQEPQAGLSPLDLEMLAKIQQQLSDIQAGQTQIRQHIDTQTYVTLYHLLPIHEEHGEEQERSAWERFRKYKSFTGKIDDAPATKR